MFSAKFCLSGSSQLVRFLKEQVRISRTLQSKVGKIRCPVDKNVGFFLTSHAQFLFIFGQCVDNCKKNLFLERNLGVTECPRSLNPRKTVAMTIFPIIVYFIA